MPNVVEGIERCERLARSIREHCLRMTSRTQTGHLGGMLSMAELLAVLYERILRVDPANPRWPDRDRFILSKGHAGGAVYAVLAEKGFFPKEWLTLYYCDNGKLMGHINHYVPGVEISTGSLGHGLPIAVGMSLAARHARKQHRIFCLMSDGDCDEGSNWEAILFAGHHHLDNLMAIVDYNRTQALGFSKEVLNLEPLAEKLRAFGWSVREIDGHRCEEIESTLKQVPFEPGKPSWIIAHTIKGKGAGFLQGTIESHYDHLNDEQLTQTLQELGVSR